MRVFVILDRSGSMSSRWDEVKSTLTGWLTSLSPKTKVWGLAFSSATFGNDQEWFAERTKASKVSLGSIEPGGLTALYDAIGTMSLTVELAVAVGKKAQILILTDGAENASRTTSRETAAEIIDSWKARGFDVVYLGADFDGFGEAHKLGISAGHTMTYDGAAAMSVAETLAQRSRVYSVTGTRPVFSDDDREKAILGDPDTAKRLRIFNPLPGARPDDA